ncbi:hypothetical protein [Xanthomonas arboricola]|uniref:hypothetical protein n=1 Tax=Xanthomonas arboricola TaxID=56448 RepID=UPI003EBDFBB7
MKKQQLVLNVSPLLKEWLRQQAATVDRSMNYIAEGILRKAHEDISADSKKSAP